MTVQKCTAACTAGGFALAGVEFAGECWCGNAFANNPTQRPDSECNMACSGNGARMFLIFCYKVLDLLSFRDVWWARPVECL
jgi:hypothetical protein